MWVLSKCDKYVISNGGIFLLQNKIFNHTIDCNQHCTVNGALLQLPGCWIVIVTNVNICHKMRQQNDQLYL